MSLEITVPTSAGEGAAAVWAGGQGILWCDGDGSAFQGATITPQERNGNISGAIWQNMTDAQGEAITFTTSGKKLIYLPANTEIRATRSGGAGGYGVRLVAEYVSTLTDEQ